MRYDGQESRTLEVQKQFPGLLENYTESFWGAGWHPTVKTLFAQLYILGVKDAYVKEKFGFLRVQVWQLEDREQVDDLVIQYNRRLTKMCYNCGVPAELLNRDGWKIALCDKCDAEWDASTGRSKYV